MVRDFVKGVLWGGVVAVAGLAVASQMAPIDRQPALAGAVDAEQPQAEGGVAPPSPAPAEGQTEVLETPPGPAQAPQDLAVGSDAADEPLLRPMAEAEAPPPASVVPDMQPAVTTAEAPKAEAAPEPAPKPAEVETPAVTEGASALPEGDGVAKDAEPAAEPAEDQVVEEETAAVVPEAETPPLPEVADATPVPETSPEAEPAPEAMAPAASLTPSTGLGEKTVEGVTTGRLPSIGAEAPAEDANAEAVAVPAADLPPVQRFARSFTNPEGKPLFAILLIDPGTAEVKRAELAGLPFPVSFVLDPMAPGAAEAAAIYRAAGQEVVMLATGIPRGATAADLEQSFAGLQGALPEAVALIDTAAAIFQDDRGLAAEVVTHLADQGRGLVTFDRGLNAADQVARREGLPAATIFRSLDDDGEDAPLIRRYLDRAAFKAAQEGSVVVIGTAREATVAALMEWAVEGRSASVALVPITAVMRAN